MPNIGRPRAEVVVADAERTALVRLTKRSRVNRAIAFRARIVLQPHRTESFTLSPDPQLVEKIRDVVGVVRGPAGECGGIPGISRPRPA